MKLSVKVVYGKTERTFSIPVGDGAKTFKWLGLVAAQRFTLRSPHGSLRLREGRGITTNESSLIPNRVYTSESVFYHPLALLSDHLNEALEVVVELVNRVPVDSLGVPQYSRWCFIAFNVSEEKNEQVREVLKAQYDEIEEDRRRLHEEELALRLREAQAKIAEMREVMRPQLQDDNLVQDLMLEEWGHMSSNGALEAIVPSYPDQSKLRNFFIGNFIALTEMYKKASAVGSDAGTGTISFMEFDAFLRECGATVSPDVAAKIFVDSHVVDRNSAAWATGGHVSLSTEMHQHEFFLALVNIANYMYITNTKGGKKQRGKKNDIGPFDAMLRLHEDCLKPYIEKHLDGTSIKAALGTDEVLLLYKEKEPELSKVFSYYGDRFADKKKTGQPTTMNSNEFFNLIKDSGLLARTQHAKGNDELTPKDVRQAFSGAQHDSAGEEEKGGGGGAEAPRRTRPEDRECGTRATTSP